VLFGQEQAGLEWGHIAKGKLIALLPGNETPDCPTDCPVLNRVIMQPTDFLNSESPHVTRHVNMECVLFYVSKTDSAAIITD
jgi:hypothetical protein